MATRKVDFVTGTVIPHHRGNIRIGQVPVPNYCGFNFNKLTSIHVPTNAVDPERLMYFLDDYVPCTEEDAWILMSHMETHGPEFIIELNEAMSIGARMYVFGTKGYGRGYSIKDCFINWNDIE